MVTPSYKKTTRAEANRTGISRKKRGQPALSNTHPRRMEVLESSVNYMYIARKANRKNASSTALEILTMNVRSWGNQGLIMMQAILLKTTEETSYQGKYYRKSNKTTQLLTMPWTISY